MHETKCRELALDGLIQVEKSGAYSNLLLNNLIEKNQLTERYWFVNRNGIWNNSTADDTLDYYLQPFLKKKG